MKVYPNLTKLIKQVILDSYGYLAGDRLDPANWTWPEDADLDGLERLASTLTEDELTLVCDEYEVWNEVVERRNAQKLDEFICEVFDGKYSENF